MPPALEYGARRWCVPAILAISAGWRLAAVSAELAVVSAAQLLRVLDLWVVNIALPALQRDLTPAALADDAWILSMYAH